MLGKIVYFDLSYNSMPAPTQSWPNSLWIKREFLVRMWTILTRTRCEYAFFTFSRRGKKYNRNSKAMKPNFVQRKVLQWQARIRQKRRGLQMMHCESQLIQNRSQHCPGNYLCHQQGQQFQHGPDAEDPAILTCNFD